jgi:hypothetical protein
MTIADGFVAGSASFVLAAGPGDGTVTITELDAVPAPEPATFGLLGAGALATTWVRRRTRVM